jgi:hypothetical protein
MIKTAPDKRKLAFGYAWQRYFVKSIRFITKGEYDGFLHGAMADYNEWVDGSNQLVYHLADSKGLVVDQVVAQFIEEPSEAKPMEAILWEQRGAVVVFAMWVDLRGPVPANSQSPSPVPLFGFWPNETMDITGAHDNYDARLLSKKEKEVPVERKIISGAFS